MFDRNSIVNEIRELQKKSVEYWNSIPAEVFIKGGEDSWSPADHVRHLKKSIFAVVKGLKMPRIFLRMMFQTSEKESRSYEDIHRIYKEALANGGKAGRFSPTPVKIEESAEVYRAKIIGGYESACAALVDTLSNWDEAALDKYRLPHPLIGKLTVREMLFFTHYHNTHHVADIKRITGTPD